MKTLRDVFWTIVVLLGILIGSLALPFILAIMIGFVCLAVVAFITYVTYAVIHDAGIEEEELFDGENSGKN